MATRTRTPRTARPTKVTIEAAREVFTVGRRFKLVGPGTTQVMWSVPAPDGTNTLTPAAEPKPAPICAGQVITFQNSRSSRIEITDPLIRQTLDTLSEYAYTAKSDGRRLYRVLAVSADKKQLVIQPLVHLSSRKMFVLVDQPTGGVTLSANVRTERRSETYVDSNGFTRQRMTYVDIKDPLTPESVADAMSSYSQEFAPVVIRSTYVRHQVALSDLPAALLQGMRLHARRQVTAALYERLGELENARRGLNRLTTGVYYRPHVCKAKAHGLDAARMIAKARELAHNPQFLLDSQARNDAAHLVRSAVAQITRGIDLARSIRTERGQALIDRITRGWPVQLRIAEGCGHYTFSTPVPVLMHSYDSEPAHLCPECAQGATMVTFRDTQVLASRHLVRYNWSDGTVRLTREPGIIGGRHSGKGIVGFIPSVTGAERDSILTLGLELEMQAVDASQREVLARELRQPLDGLLTPVESKKYIHFEEDGSTGVGGFEMVTGYTDLATHAKLLGEVLGRDAPRFSGRLRSHDATGQACGIHVHVQKPKSLIHAMKIQQFVHSPQATAIIKVVARRYNTTFAKITTDNRTVNKMTADAIRAAKSLRTAPLQEYHKRTAMERINGDRYQAVNFQNRATVEFRLYRGSMIYGTVMACMQLSAAIWRWTAETPGSKLTQESFLAWINRADNRHDTRELRLMLSRKGFDVVVPRPNKKKPDLLAVQPTEPALA